MRVRCSPYLFAIPLIFFSGTYEFFSTVVARFFPRPATREVVKILRGERGGGGEDGMLGAPVLNYYDPRFAVSPRVYFVIAESSINLYFRVPQRNVTAVSIPSPETDRKPSSKREIGIA